MPHKGQVTNPKTDHRVKYNLRPRKVKEAMEEAGLDKNADLHPGALYGPAAEIADRMDMDYEDRNLREGIARFAKREGLIDGEE